MGKKPVLSVNLAFLLMLCFKLFIQVTVILIAHQLKFPDTTEPQTFASGVAVKPLCFTCSVYGAWYLRDIKAES